MNNTTKFLIATGVAAVGIGLTVYYGKKMQEKEAVATDIQDDEIPVIDEKNTGFIGKIKAAATKKVIKILAWAVVHEQQLQAFATLLSVGAGIFHIISAAKEYYRGEKLINSLDSIVEHNKQFEILWDNHMVNAQKDHNDVMQKLNDIHLDMGGIHQLQEALIPESV